MADHLQPVPAEQVAAIGFSYQCYLDENKTRTLVANTHVPADSSAVEINEVLDKIAKVMRRQGAIHELAAAEIERKLRILKLQNLEAQEALVYEASKARWLARGDRRGEWSIDQMPHSEKQAIEANANARQQYKTNLEEMDLRIEELKREIAGDAEDSGADRHAGVP